MKLIFENLPKPYYRTGEHDVEYEPTDYYDELIRQMDQYFQDVSYQQFKQSMTIENRRHLIQYFKLRKWNELYKQCLTELYEI